MLLCWHPVTGTDILKSLLFHMKSNVERHLQFGLIWISSCSSFNKFTTGLMEAHLSTFWNTHNLLISMDLNGSLLYFGVEMINVTQRQICRISKPLWNAIQLIISHIFAMKLSPQDCTVHTKSCNFVNNIEWYIWKDYNCVRHGSRT